MFSAKQISDSAQLEPFQFQNLEGEPRELPHMKMLSLDQGMRILADAELEQVINEVAPGLGTEIAHWPAHVIEGFVVAWQKHSDVMLPGGEPGKSSAPSTSSPSTAARSRRTSHSGGSRSKR